MKQVAAPHALKHGANDLTPTQGANKPRLLDFLQATQLGTRLKAPDPEGFLLAHKAQEP